MPYHITIILSKGEIIFSYLKTINTASINRSVFHFEERDTFWLSAAKSHSLHLLCPDLENYFEQIIDLLFDVPFEKKV